jgi:hypothetical protein
MLAKLLLLDELIIIQKHTISYQLTVSQFRNEIF